MWSTEPVLPARLGRSDSRPVAAAGLGAVGVAFACLTVGGGVGSEIPMAPAACETADCTERGRLLVAAATPPADSNDAVETARVTARRLPYARRGLVTGCVSARRLSDHTSAVTVGGSHRGSSAMQTPDRAAMTRLATWSQPGGASAGATRPSNIRSAVSSSSMATKAESSSGSSIIVVRPLSSGAGRDGVRLGAG